jgi:hypothetical protein
VQSKFGICYRPPGINNLLIAFEKDEHHDTKFGVEFWLRRQILDMDIAIRFGSNHTKGITLKIPENYLGANLMQFDYAWAGDDFYSSVAITYEYITSLFKLRNVWIDSLFRNLYVCTYKSVQTGKIPVGTITVENKMQDIPVDVWININMKEYTDNKFVPVKMQVTLDKIGGVRKKKISEKATATSTATVTTTLGSATTTSVIARISNIFWDVIPAWIRSIVSSENEYHVVEQVKKRHEGKLLDRCSIPPGYIANIRMVEVAVMDDVLLNTAGRVTVPLELKLYYTLRDEIKEITPAVGDIAICGNKGTGTYQVNWRYPEMVSTFMVVKKDTFIAEFMNEVIRCYQKTKEIVEFPVNKPENIFKVIYLFDVLKTWGITYAERRNYLTGARDVYLRCPDELLGGRFTRGNDEDLAVLFATCIKYWGVPVAFLDGGPPGKPNLIFMFASGIPADKGTQTEGYNKVFLFDPAWDKEKTWIPVRMTKWEDNFVVLYEAGMAFYKGEEEPGKKAKEKYTFKAVFLPDDEHTRFIPSIPLRKPWKRKLVFSDKFWRQVYDEFRMDVQKINEIKAYKKFFGEVKVKKLSEIEKKNSRIKD